MAEKTEKPTEKKFRDSAKKGQSFKGKDLIAAAVVASGILTVSAVTSIRSLGGVIKRVLLAPQDINIPAYLLELFQLYLGSLMPVLLACLVPGALLALLQSRFRLATEAIKINFSHLNPISGLKKIFGLRPLKELVKALLYLLVFSVSVYVFFTHWGPYIFSLCLANIEQLIARWNQLTLTFVFLFLGVALILLLLDTMAELYLFVKELKMEKQEVKKEHKNNEGDPHIKQQRKQIHRELLSEEMKSNTRQANFILANPTHIAIAIYLNWDVMPLPFISVREVNARALAVIALAEQHNIPVVRNAPLARRIYRNNRCYSYVRDDELLEVLDIYLWLRMVEAERNPAAVAQNPTSPQAEDYPSPESVMQELGLPVLPDAESPDDVSPKQKP